MKLLDWRRLPASAVAPLYDRESIRWRAALAWDTAPSWEVVESARTTWGLPGLACVDRSRRIRGWTFFVVREDHVSVGLVSAESARVTELLARGILRRAGHATRLEGFVRADAPGLAETLDRLGVAYTRYAYQARVTASTGPGDASVPAGGSALEPFQVSAWNVDAADETAGLLRACYGTAGRTFARDNSPGSWRDYVRELAEHPGCGLLSPALSRQVRADGRLRAVTLVTSLAPDTAHIAQLAVDPALRRCGLARYLVADALRAARAAGYARLSLLVSEENTAALDLYRRFGFEECGAFFALHGARARRHEGVRHAPAVSTLTRGA